MVEMQTGLQLRLQLLITREPNKSNESYVWVKFVAQNPIQIKDKWQNLLKSNLFLRCTQIPARLEDQSKTPNKISWLKVPSDNHTILNVSIALWRGCKDDLLFSKPFTLFQSAEKKPIMIKKLLLSWVSISYIIRSSPFLNKSVSVLV